MGSENEDTGPFPGKYIIGLTGNIATGKSAVLRLAVEKGALVIDADKVVHDILDEDADVQQAIGNAFGSKVIGADGRVNRPLLGKIVFNAPEALRQLELIVHPAVGRHIAQLILDNEAEIVMIEAIKLLEGNLRLLCRQIWVTTCSRETQMERLRVCRGMDEQTAAERIDAQAPQEEKIAQADVVIDTNGLLVETEKQFLAAWSRLPID